MGVYWRAQLSGCQPEAQHRAVPAVAMDCSVRVLLCNAMAPPSVSSILTAFYRRIPSTCRKRITIVRPIVVMSSGHCFVGIGVDWGAIELAVLTVRRLDVVLADGTTNRHSGAELESRP